MDSWANFWPLFTFLAVENYSYQIWQDNLSRGGFGFGNWIGIPPTCGGPCRSNFSFYIVLFTRTAFDANLSNMSRQITARKVFKGDSRLATEQPSMQCDGNVGIAHTHYFLVILSTTKDNSDVIVTESVTLSARS